MAVACRSGCAACCIAPSISSCEALPTGKPAGVPCPHLDDELRCVLFGAPTRPAVCGGLQPQVEMCGDSAAEAMATLISWERLTMPRVR
ncbi:MAG: YkgJ family cysteine cluster protein [Proteobacteria bacterium]|nr:YkgJ family cysteine cluster protein [Pseudomonadota bacterium]